MSLKSYFIANVYHLNKYIQFKNWNLLLMLYIIVDITVVLYLQETKLRIKYLQKVDPTEAQQRFLTGDHIWKGKLYRKYCK